jgi:hypothetical protein
MLTSLVRRNRQHLAGIREGMVEGADVIFQESQRLVPKEFENLKESGYVTLMALEKNVRIEIAYEAPYAVYVHERQDLAHGAEYNSRYADDIAAGRKTARQPQEQAKYLEDAIRSKRRELLRLVRSKAKKV